METDAFIPETLQCVDLVSTVKTPVISNETLVPTLVFSLLRQDYVEMETRNTFYAAEILESIWYQKAKNEISNFKTLVFGLCLLVQIGPKISAAQEIFLVSISTMSCLKRWNTNVATRVLLLVIGDYTFVDTFGNWSQSTCPFTPFGISSIQLDCAFGDPQPLDTLAVFHHLS